MYDDGEDPAWSLVKAKKGKGKKEKSPEVDRTGDSSSAASALAR